MILIGLGSNLDGVYGSPMQCLQACSQLLADKGIYIIQSSNVWESAPVPISDQPWFCNAVCTVETVLSPEELLEILAELEDSTGRERAEENAARALDLDILCYNNVIKGEGDLVLPHPRMHERAFVLHPLSEVMQNWRHPVLDKTVDEMIKTLPKGQETRRIDNSKLQSTSVDQTKSAGGVIGSY